jgi:hypothetical protein
MRLTRSFITAALSLTLVACNEPNGPIDADVEFARNTRNDTETIAVADDGTSSTTRKKKDADGATASGAPATTINQSADAPPLMTYSTSFKAVQGQGNTFVVFYQNPWNPEFFVQFGPHGSTFLGRSPAELSFNLKFADLNGQEPAGLEVWYQPSAGTEWNPEPTTVDANGNRVLMDLYHFSNYAVAW